MENEISKVRRYSEALKQEVVSAVKRGMSYQEACKKYAIRAPSTVYDWVNRQGTGTGARNMEGKNKKSRYEVVASKQLEQEKRELEIALGKMSLRVHCLETVLDEASKHYKEDLKKKFIQQ